MSVEVVKSYTRTRMHSLGYTKEHIDAFDDNTIDKAQMNKVYFIELKQMAQRVKTHNRHYEVRLPFEVHILRAPTKAPIALLDSALVAADAIVSDMTLATNKFAYSNTKLKDVRFESMAVEPLAGSNDNSVRVVIRFQALVMFPTAA